MKYDAFCEELRQAGLSGRAFARLLKLNPNSITNYKARGEVPSHLAVIASLIRALYDAGIDYVGIIARVPIEKKAARGVAIKKQVSTH
jgi:hypothetical protein